MEQKYFSKKARVLITLSTITALAGLGYLLVKSDKSPTSQYAEGQTPTDSITHTEVRSATIPVNIPFDLPFMQEGEVLQNFSNIDNNIGTQSVRRWTINANTETILLAYQDYFQKHGWNIISVHDSDNSSVVGVAKNDIALSISINQDAAMRQSIIEISTNKNNGVRE